MNRDLLTVRVTRKIPGARGTCTFELSDPLGGCLPPFSAGAHIDVQIREGLFRQYSLCNNPNERHRYEISVLRESRSGIGRVMCENVGEGDLIQISKPQNGFPLTCEAKRTLLLAGGMGVTPILCMAEHLSNMGADFEMHYCTRSRNCTAFLERIKTSSFSNNVRFYFDDSPTEQRLDIPALLDAPNLETHIYVCGPVGLIEYVVRTCKMKGWADRCVHFQCFRPTI